MKRLASFVIALTLTITLPASAQSLRDRLSEKIPDSKRLLLALTPEDEVRVGQQVAANLLGIAPLVPDDGLQRYVNLVGRWVAMHSERPDLPWRFGVIDSADVNAFAAPGGYILITRGLYASMSDESELAGVLGHEIAHVVEKHHIELMRKTALIDEGREAVERRIKDKDELIKRLVGNGAEIFARRLDQAAEFEADRRGIVYATRAGYTPYGLPAVLQKIASVAPDDDRLQLLFKTHPTPAVRLQQLERVGDVLARFDRAGHSGALYPLR
jgi:beta-barrel assembly-enhancing protease